MKRNSLKLFWMVLLSVLALSCSFEIKNTGDISFNLPTRQKGVLSGITYDVEVVKNGSVIRNETGVQNQVTLEKIPVGLCTIKISGKDDTYEYYGENDVTVIGGKTVPCQITLSKTLIEKPEVPPVTPEVPPVEEDKLTGIELSLTTGAYVEYGTTFKLGEKIIIKEIYEKAGLQTPEKTNYSNYTVTPDSGTKVGPMTVTVKHKTAGIEKTIEISCKYRLKDLSSEITINPTTNSTVAMFNGTQELKVTVPALTAPNDKDTISYKWQECDTQTGPYKDVSSSGNSANYAATNLDKSKYYKCIITETSCNTSYCLDSKPLTYEKQFYVKAEPWNIVLTENTKAAEVSEVKSEGQYTLTLSNATGTAAPSDISWTVETTDGYEIIGTNVLKVPVVSETADKIATVTATTTGGQVYASRKLMLTNRVVKSITASLNDPKYYVPYNQTVDISKFTITKTFDRGSDVTEVANTSDYTITPSTAVTTLGDNTFTITYKGGSQPATTVTVPCKFSIETPTITIDESSLGAIPQYTGAKKLTVNVKFSIYDLTKEYNIAYQWTKDGKNISSGTTNSLDVSNDKTAEYNCNVTATPKTPAYCVEGAKSVSSSANKSTTVNVQPWSLGLTGSSETADKLKGEKSYKLQLSNTAGSDLAGKTVTWESSNTEFSVTDGSFTSPKVGSAIKSSTITAKIDKNVLATIDVAVPARAQTGIEATLENYVTYGTPVTADMFNISDVYDNGDKVAVTNYDGYSVSGTPAVGNSNTFTITKTGTKFTSTVQNVICKYSLVAPSSVTLSSTGDVNIAKVSGTEILTATAASLTAPNNTDILEYHWYESSSSGGTYSEVNTVNTEKNKFNISDLTADKWYKCKVVVKPSTANKDYCLTTSEVSKESSAVHYAVQPWTIGFADGASAGNLEGGKTYTLTLSNTAAEVSTLKNLNWKVYEQNSKTEFNDLTIDNSKYSFTVPSLNSDKSVDIVALNGVTELNKITVTLKKVATPPAVQKETAANFGQLQAAIGKLTSSNNNMEITITGDILMDGSGIVIGTADSSKQNCIIGNYNVTLKSDKAAVKFSRGGSYSGALFTVGKGCTLNVIGTSNAQITLDGATNSGSSQLIRSFGNLELDYCNLQNNTNNNSGSEASTLGGAIYMGVEKASAQVNPVSPMKFTMKNSTVSDNTVTAKGAIIYLYCNKNYDIKAIINNSFVMTNSAVTGAIMFENTESSKAPTLTITGSSIDENTATSTGGGINIKNVALTLDGGTVSNNKSTGSTGGGINVSGAASIVTLNNGVVIGGNNAKGNGGGINLNAGSELVINNGIIYGNDSTSSNNNIGNSANNSINVVANTSHSFITTSKGKQEYSSNKSFSTTIDHNTDMATAN